MSQPRVVAIVQARMGSTRLPSKVLAKIEGRPMLARVIERLKHCTQLGEIIIATTQNMADDAVCDVAAQNDVLWYRYKGKTSDVLSRYVAAARWTSADVVVRVTADCPLLDPGVVDKVVVALVESRHKDYASNVLVRTYPRGLDVEAMWLDTVLRLDRYSLVAADREHVTRHLLGVGRPSFDTRSVSDTHNRSTWRWTVDTQDDLEYMRELYRVCGLAKRILPYEEVAALIEAGKVPLRTEADEPERTVPVT